MLSTKHSLKSEYKPYDSKSYILYKKRRNFIIYLELLLKRRGKYGVYKNKVI